MRSHRAQMSFEDAGPGWRRRLPLARALSGYVVRAFAEMKGHVREHLARAGLVVSIGAKRFYRTVGEAVRTTYVAGEHVDWVDWQDRR